MPSQSSPDGTAARALRAADPTLRPHPTPLFRSPQPRPHGIAAWLCRCLLGVALCAVLAACASSGQTGPSGVADPSGVTGVLGQSGTASGAAMGTARDAASAAPSHGQTGSKADGQTGGTAPASPAMARDGLPTGLPFASAGEPRVHMPAPAAETAPVAAPRGLADFALVEPVEPVEPQGQDGRNGQDGPYATTAQDGFGDASGRPILRILYNASTKGTLHPCPS